MTAAVRRTTTDPHLGPRATVTCDTCGTISGPTDPATAADRAGQHNRTEHPA